MSVGTIQPMALAHLSQEWLSLVISRRCHSALYWRSKRHFLPEVSHGLARSRASPVAALEVQAFLGTASERITKVSLHSTRSRLFFNGTGPFSPSRTVNRVHPSGLREWRQALTDCHGGFGRLPRPWYAGNGASRSRIVVLQGTPNT